MVRDFNGCFCTFAHLYIDKENAETRPMIITVKFKGTPAKFADVYWQVAAEVSLWGGTWVDSITGFMWPRPIDVIEIDNFLKYHIPSLPANIMTVKFWLASIDDKPIDMEESDAGEITAEEHCDCTLVTLEANDKDWPQLQNTWELIIGEIQARGWIDSQGKEPPYRENANTQPLQSRGLDELPTATEGRRIWRGYNINTAKEIVKALPKAFELFEIEGGSWGPSYISKFCPPKPATIGRYLKVFHRTGRKKLNGIDLPDDRSRT